MSLVGRAEEIARAGAVLDRGLAGRASLVLFAGEAGIGKTSLADALATKATERGANVVWGRCWEAGGAPAYWPWTEVFRALGDVDPFAQAAETSASEGQQARFRAFERGADLLRAAARAQPLVLVLDDLHAADVPSLLFLHLVARGLRAGGKLVILGTYRDAEARLATEVFPLLSKIGREGEVIQLGRLNREDVIAWIRHAQPSATEAAAARVHDVTDGNPLFVTEVLSSRKTLDSTQLPDGLRAILDQHVARASSELRDLLTTVSVLGREATFSEIAALTELGADDVALRLKEARDAGLLVVVPGVSEHHAFAHMLIREHLYGELAPVRRAALHEACGERLALQGDLAGAAHHLFRGGSPQRAASVARDAARSAIARLAFEDAAQLARRALSVLPADLGESELACDLEIVLAESLIRAGESVDGKDASLRAAAMAKRHGRTSLLARAALVYGAEMTSAVVDPVMVDLLRQALAGLEERDDVLRALVMARLASALVPPPSHRDIGLILSLARDGVAMARRLRDPETLLYTLRFAGAACGYLVSLQERLAYLEETVELATRLDRPVILVETTAVLSVLLRESGRLLESQAALDRYLRLLREFPQAHYQWRRPLVLSGHALLDGDFARSDDLAKEGYEIAAAGGIFMGMLCWALHRTASALLRADPSCVASDAERCLEIFARLPPSAQFGKLMSGMLLAVVGRVAEARVCVAGYELDALNFPLMITLGCTALHLRDTGIAEDVLGPLLDLRRANQIFWSMQASSVFGPTSQIAGELAAMLGRNDEARGLLEEALAVGQKMGSPAVKANARRHLEALGAAPPASRKSASPPPRPSAAQELTLEREGDVWRIRSSAGGEAVLKDAKGLHYLAELLRNPGRELHVTQLADMLEPAGDAGPVLDAKAKDGYRRRLEDLRDQLEEARRFNDEARASRAEEEIDALVEQLAKAVGLGGRDRKVGSHVERARINVQRRLKDVLRRVEEQDPALGRYLAATLKTGTWCVFSPI